MYPVLILILIVDPKKKYGLENNERNSSENLPLELFLPSPIGFNPFFVSTAWSPKACLILDESVTPNALVYSMYNPTLPKNGKRNFLDLSRGIGGDSAKETVTSTTLESEKDDSFSINFVIDSDDIPSQEKNKRRPLAFLLWLTFGLLKPYSKFE